MVRNKLKELTYTIVLRLLGLFKNSNQFKANDVKFKIDVKRQNVVIISPHPDDEIIGCSSVIYDSISNGNEVHVILLTGNNERINETRTALKRLYQGINLHFLNYQDGELSGKETEITDSLISKISDLELSKFVLFIPYKKDFHADHIAAYFSAMNVYKHTHNITECYSYRTNHINLLSDFSYYNTIEIETKRRAYSCFISQSYLCFENLFKIRRLYHSVNYELESELFSINKLDDLYNFVDYRSFSDFKRFENNLSDIHPYKLFSNHDNAHREFLDNVKK